MTSSWPDTHPAVLQEETQDILVRLEAHLIDEHPINGQFVPQLWKLHWLPDEDCPMAARLVVGAPGDHPTTAITAAARFFESAISAADHRVDLYGLALAYQHLEVVDVDADTGQGTPVPARTVMGIDRNLDEYVVTRSTGMALPEATIGREIFCCGDLGSEIADRLREVVKTVVCDER